MNPFHSQCKNCTQYLQLELKAVVHHCEAVFTKVHGFPKIAGPDVILAHRLIKNSVNAREFVIATSGFFDDVDVGAEGGKVAIGKLRWFRRNRRSRLLSAGQMFF